MLVYGLVDAINPEREWGNICAYGPARSSICVRRLALTEKKLLNAEVHTKQELNLFLNLLFLGPAML